MEKLFRKMMVPSIISSIVFMILGVVIFIYPEVTLEIIAKVIGFLIIGLGIVGIVQYLTHKEESSFKLNILYIATTIIVGILAVYNYKLISSVIPIIIGIWVCFDSFIKFRMSLAIKSIGENKWKLPLIMSIITFVIGIVIIFEPFATAIVITKITAVCIVVYSIIDILQDYTIVKRLK